MTKPERIARMREQVAGAAERLERMERHPLTQEERDCREINSLKAELAEARAHARALTEKIADMQRASDLADAADNPSDYNVRLVALALMARQFLRRAALVPPSGEK